MTRIEQADRLKDAPLSEIRTILNYANELESQGREIIHLEIGEPDFDSPELIKEAAKRAMDEGKVHYPPITGVQELKEAIADKLSRENGLSYLPDEILLTNGVAQGIFLSIMAFLNDGDEILVPDPGYLCYFTVPKIAGAKVNTYLLNENTGFQITVEELEQKITPKTKMIVLISPNNPTGSVLSEESINAMAYVAIKHDLIVVADEIYEKLIYGDSKHISIGSMKGMKERTITLNGFSKYYAMMGWRLGYIATDKKLYEPLMRLCFYNLTSANSFVQWGAIEALTGDQSVSEAMVAEYKKRRDFMVEEINKIDKLSCIVPEGAFYVFMNIEKMGIESDQFCRYLLDTAGVATVPGEVFGDNGKGFVRLSYANSMKNIAKAMTKMKEAVDQLSNNR